jgi:trk system potassium uptake protein TrkA
MNVIILGAGTVGTSIAEVLCANNVNVALVDNSRRALDDVEDQLDVQTVFGSACDATTLFQAGASSALLCLAVTDRDEVNLVGASIAKAMGTSRSVARVVSPTFRDVSTFDYQRHFMVDRLLSLEHLTALELAKAVRARRLFAVENFARGGIEVQEVAAEPGSKRLNVPLKDLKLPRGVRIGLISNTQGTIIAGADDFVQAGDHVTLIGTRAEVEEAKRLFEHKPPPNRNVIIAGGGEIGFHLALLLEHGRFNVVLLESDETRCEFLARRLEITTVLHADTRRRSEMEEARVGKADIFVATTGRDEDNIICGVEAKELGATRILAVVRRPDYANVLGKLGIDSAISPREVMAKQILGMVEPGPIRIRSESAGGDAEVWEIEVAENTPITQAALKDIQTPQTLIAAIEREDFVRVPGADDHIRPGDTAIVLVQRDSRESALELFVPTN